jgi:hypothetical protein
MGSRLVRLSVAIGFAFIVSATARAQERGVRFLVSQVRDSVLEFQQGTAKWIKKGKLGFVVDPSRRDALVAQLRIDRVAGGMVMAVVTAQTQPLSIDHVVVLDEPPPAWYRRLSLWAGLAVGAALGFLAGAAT